MRKYRNKIRKNINLFVVGVAINCGIEALKRQFTCRICMAWTLAHIRHTLGVKECVCWASPSSTNRNVMDI